MSSEPAETLSWLADLEAARRAVETGIRSKARAAVDKAFATSAIQALACHENLCDNTTIASNNAIEWHSFFRELYRITWRSLIPKALIFVSDNEKGKASKYETMFGLLDAIKITACDALTAIDAFAEKPNRSSRRAAIRSVELACNALDSWRPG